MPERSPFRTWNGIQAFEFVDGVRLHAIGGDQVLLCRVVYEPGKQVTRHAHEHTEQLMAIISIAQHARPNVTGQIDDRRAHCTIFSTLVVSTGMSKSASSPINQQSNLQSEI